MPSPDPRDCEIDDLTQPALEVDDEKAAPPQPPPHDNQVRQLLVAYRTLGFDPSHLRGQVQ